MAGAPPEVFGAVQLRGLRIVCQRRWISFVEPPRRGRRAPKGFQRPEELLARWILRPIPGRGDCLRGPRVECAAIHRECDRARECRGDRRLIARRCGESSATGHGSHREGIPRRHGPSFGCGDALPGRRLSFVPVQEIHRCPVGLCTGAAGGLLWRRPRQLRVSALRPRYLFISSLRGRQTREGAALPEVVQGGCSRGRINLRLGASGPHGAHAHRRRVGVPSRPSVPDCARLSQAP